MIAAVEYQALLVAVILRLSRARVGWRVRKEMGTVIRWLWRGIRRAMQEEGMIKLLQRGGRGGES